MASEPEAEPPEIQPEPGPEFPDGGSSDRIVEALATMPRGIPMPLLGIPMKELAGMILSAERDVSPTGAPLVLLKGKWYHADESDPKIFMVEHKQ